MKNEFLSKITFDNLQPAMVDEPDESTTYVGFCLKDCNGFSDPKWLIKRIQKNGTEQSIFFANGSLAYNQRWSDRKILPYKPTSPWNAQVYQDIADFYALELVEQGNYLCDYNAETAPIWAAAFEQLVTAESGHAFPWTADETVFVHLDESENRVFTRNGRIYRITETEIIDITVPTVADIVAYFDKKFGTVRLENLTYENESELEKIIEAIDNLTANYAKANPLIVKTYNNKYALVTPFSDSEVVELEFDEDKGYYIFIRNGHYYRIVLHPTDGNYIEDCSSEYINPEEPQVSRGEYSHNSVTLNIGKPENYTVKRNGVVMATEQSGGSFTDTGLQPHTLQHYEVYNDNIVRSKTEEIDIRTQPMPLDKFIVGACECFDTSHFRNNNYHQGELPSIPSDVRDIKPEGNNHFPEDDGIDFLNVPNAYTGAIKPVQEYYNLAFTDKGKYAVFRINPRTSGTYKVRASISFTTQNDDIKAVLYTRACDNYDGSKTEIGRIDDKCKFGDWGKYYSYATVEDIHLDAGPQDLIFEWANEEGNANFNLLCLSFELQQ